MELVTLTSFHVKIQEVYGIFPLKQGTFVSQIIMKESITYMFMCSFKGLYVNKLSAFPKLTKTNSKN